MLSLRLFLPESWTSDAARMVKAGVPDSFQSYRTKPELAIEEIDRVIAGGVRFGCVLADAGYGLSASFRQALSVRDLCWAVGIPRHQKVYPAAVQLIFPIAGRGRPRVRHVPDVKSCAAHAMLADAKWRQISWRRGTKGRLTARFFTSQAAGAVRYFAPRVRPSGRSDTNSTLFASARGSKIRSLRCGFSRLEDSQCPKHLSHRRTRVPRP